MCIQASQLRQDRILNLQHVALRARKKGLIEPATNMRRPEDERRVLQRRRCLEELALRVCLVIAVDAQDDDWQKWNSRN